MVLILLPVAWTAALSYAGWARSAQAAKTVDSLVARALVINPEIVAARQKLAESDSHLAEMVSHRRLQLNLNGTASVSTGQVAEPVSNQTFGSVDASLVASIPNFAKADAEIQQAAASSDVARAQLRRALLEVKFRTSQAYFELLRAQDGERIAAENLAQAQRQVDDANKRVALGDIPPADVLKLRVPVSQDQAALARAKSSVRMGLQNLNDLLQQDLDAPISLEPAGVNSSGDLAAAAAEQTADRQSPDVLEADATLRAAEFNEKVVRRDRDPDFAFEISHTRTSDPTAYRYLSAAALTISLPISEGGGARAKEKQAKLQTDQARTALKLAKQHTRLTVGQAALEVETDIANARATAEAEEIARQSLEKSRQSYVAGLTTTRDVLDAELVYSQARIDANSARYNLAIARAHLSQLIGEVGQ